MSEFNHRVTLAAPENLIEAANHLACILGESAADIETFRDARYEDSAGNKYSVCSNVVNDEYIESLTVELKPTPPHAEGVADRDLALVAFNSINQPDGIKMVILNNPFEALIQMGIDLIPDDEEEYIP